MLTCSSFGPAILAGEANSPGTFSKRTVELVSTLDKRDAELFTKFCACMWMIVRPTPFINDINNPFKHDSSTNFDSLQHLGSLGLIHTLGYGEYGQEVTSKQLTVSYYGKKVVLQLPGDGTDFPVGSTQFTNPGQNSQECVGHLQIRHILSTS